MTTNISTIHDRITKYKAHVDERAATLMGYPESMHFDYAPLHDFMGYNIDNLGDPYSDLLYGVNSCEFEREVISYFATMYHLKEEDAWGYVTSSGTEGNLYGLFLGRELHQEAVLYYSADAHYSIAKAGRLLRMPMQVIPSLPNGEIDYDALREAVDAHPGKPAVVVATLGTTFTGAIDNVDKIAAIFEENNRTDFYIHCDAALSGMMLPFMKDLGAPQISFDKPIGSVSVSGHKFIGAPYPCGIVVARKEHVERIQTAIEYIGALDSTIGGSRNGQAPLYLWYAIESRGHSKGFHQEVAKCLDMADYLCERLEAISYPYDRNPHSNTVTFKEPHESVVRKWQLARVRGKAHIITVPHASREKIDAFIDDLLASIKDA